MGVFRRIIFSALVAGLLAGIALSLVQRVQVVPLIRSAEHYETAGANHQHEPARSGVRRMVNTVGANVLIGVSFALLLVAVFSLRQPVGVVQGLFWGTAGFAIFFVVPALGLPPELPGSVAAPLFARQAWWWLAVSCAAVALALVFLQQRWMLRTVGLAIILIPFLLGAPESPVQQSSLPARLPAQFLWATAAANLMFWLVLGTACAWLFRHDTEHDML